MIKLKKIILIISAIIILGISAYSVLDDPELRYFAGKMSGLKDMPDLSSKKFGVNTSNISRSAFLDRYRSAIDDDFSNQIFRDIISVNISLPSNEATLFENELKTFGYMVPSTNPSIDLETRTTNFEKTPAKGINSITYRGPDLDIVLDRILPPKDLSDKNNVNQPGGIYAFTMNTNPVTCTTTHQFGDNCYLVVNKKGKAVWYFNTKS